MIQELPKRPDGRAVLMRILPGQGETLDRGKVPGGSAGSTLARLQSRDRPDGGGRAAGPWPWAACRSEAVRPAARCRPGGVWPSIRKESWCPRQPVVSRRHVASYCAPGFNTKPGDGHPCSAVGRRGSGSSPRSFAGHGGGLLRHRCHPPRSLAVDPVESGSSPRFQGFPGCSLTPVLRNSSRELMPTSFPR